jgi:CysZ protein
MIAAALLALQDALSPEFRKVLWKALGLAILLFIGILIGLEVAISLLVAFPWPWLETILAVATGLGVFAAFFFLMAPVTAVFAGLFLDDIAALVEIRDYPTDAPGKPLATAIAIWTGVQFGLLVLIVNLLLLPTLFIGIGAVMMVIGNAYLLGREYFSMIAMRHMPAREAKELRKLNSARVFAAGLIPAGLALVPVVNLFVPLFATSYFVHIFKKIQSEPAA